MEGTNSSESWLLSHFNVQESHWFCPNSVAKASHCFRHNKTRRNIGACLSGCSAGWRRRKSEKMSHFCWPRTLDCEPLKCEHTHTLTSGEAWKLTLLSVSSESTQLKNRLERLCINGSMWKRQAVTRGQGFWYVWQVLATGGERLLRCYSLDPLMLLPAPFGSIWDAFLRVQAKYRRGQGWCWEGRDGSQKLPPRYMESVGSSSWVLNKNAYNKSNTLIIVLKKH